jgi:hypothetical protein
VARLRRAPPAVSRVHLIAFDHQTKAVDGLGSAAMLATALAITHDPVSSATAGTATTVQLLYLRSASARCPSLRVRRAVAFSTT